MRNKIKKRIKNIDWYIKWSASIILLMGIISRASGLNAYDLIFSFLGCGLWLVVACLWNDRALIMLNSVDCEILLLGIMNNFNDVYLK